MDLREHTEILRSRIARQPLAGQKALVTGASSGIGRAVAIALAEAGAAVVVNYIAGENEAHEVTDLIASMGGRAMALRADVSNEAQVVEMFEEACAIYGTLDIVVMQLIGRQMRHDLERLQVGLMDGMVEGGQFRR